MKKHFLLVVLLFFLFFQEIYSQNNVGIGVTTPEPRSILELSADDKGFLMPRLTSSQRHNNIDTLHFGNAIRGLMVYDIDTKSFWYVDSLPGDAHYHWIQSLGPAGPAGAQGPIGPAGPAGTNGANGVTGPTGPAGTNGTNGVTGPTGPAGANGTNGANGATGATGATGPTGTNGTNGSAGATGATGPTGTNGTNGAAGATGAAGVTGATGPSGADGSTGATGPGGAGSVGPTGPTGATGTNGTNGAAGATGATGATGTNGTNGSNGAAGATGATGATGTNGTNGTNGSAGATGATGATGPVGCASANYIMKSNGAAATCTQAPIFELAASPYSVGIGTTAPDNTFRMDIEGNGIANGLIVYTSGDFDGVDSYIDGAAPYYNTYYGKSINVPTNGTSFGNAQCNISFDGSMASSKTYSIATYGLLTAATATNPMHAGGIYGAYGDNGSPSYLEQCAGAVAYRSSGGTYYSFYGMGYNSSIPGASGGKLINPGISSSSTLPTAQVGFGLTGGVMGGWINSPLYGMYLKGNRYGLYTDGQSYSNNIVVQLGADKTSPDKLIPTYTPTSTSVDVITRGTGKLINGKAVITFENNFTNSLSDKSPVNVTVTPLGDSKGVYVTNITSTGFVVNENSAGKSNVEFNWVAIGVKDNYEQPQIPDELLSKTYNEDMHNVMVPDNSGSDAQPIWWDGEKVRFDAIPDSFKNLACPKYKQK